jgi:hypothetical protein
MRKATEMSVRDLERFEIILPKKEIDLGNLTAQQIIDKIKAFYVRWENNSEDLAEAEFLQNLVSYPVSMCSYTMTENLKLLVALVYFDNKNSSDDWKGFTFDYLSLVFDRSKSSIHEAVTQKEAEAKAIIQEANLKLQLVKEARDQAKRELVEAEKLKLQSNISGEQTE